MTAAYTAIVIELPNEFGIVQITRRRAPAGDGASLKFLQDSVRTDPNSRGFIEHLVPPREPTLDFWFNEEGKLDGLGLNSVATDLLTAFWPEWAGWDVLVGNVVLTGNDGPETADAPDGLWEALQTMPWLTPVAFTDEVTPDDPQSTSRGDVEQMRHKLYPLDDGAGQDAGTTR